MESEQKRNPGFPEQNKVISPYIYFLFPITVNIIRAGIIFA
jgi:hypothetical protein